MTDQTPAGGAIVPNNATIVLYLGEEKPDTLCTVPNVVGKTASEANRMLTNAGLIMKVAGATSSSSGNVYAISQSQAAGTRWLPVKWSPFSLVIVRCWTNSTFCAFFDTILRIHGVLTCL